MTRLASDYRRFCAKRRWLLFALVLAVTVSLVFDVATGPSRFPLADIWQGLVDRASLSPAQAVILWEVRLPYGLMAVLVGAALGLSGAEMQTVLNNPLASPFTLGVAAAATFGASLAIVLQFDAFGLGAQLGVPLLAFVFATGAIALIQILSNRYGASVDTVVLFGIALLFSFEALGWMLQFIADADALQQIVFWTIGSLARATWPKLLVLAVVLAVCGAAAMRQAWLLTALRGGEAQARSLGVAVERLRLVVLLRASLLCAVALSFVGTIGFVGLLGPHVSRLLLGEDHRFYLPGAALAGALMLSLASIASKTVVPGVVLPIGIVTALVGVPLFMSIILGRKRVGS